MIQKLRLVRFNILFISPMVVFASILFTSYPKPGAAIIIAALLGIIVCLVKIVEMKWEVEDERTKHY